MIAHKNGPWCELRNKNICKLGGYDLRSNFYPGDAVDYAPGL